MSVSTRFFVTVGLIACATVAGCGSKKAEDSPSGNETADAATGAEKTSPPLNCPSSFDIPAPASGAPEDSVGGLRLGTPLDKATLYIRCQDKSVVYTVNTGGGGFELNAPTGGEVRQVTRVANDKPTEGPPMDPMEYLHQRQREAENRRNNIGNDEDEPTDVYQLLAMGRKGAERLDGIWHSQKYLEGKMPSAADTAKALVAKYGEPSRLTESSSGAYMTWMYDNYGRKMTDKTPGFGSCDGKVPARYGSLSASPDCGLAIAASIDKPGNNELLVARLSIGVMNPSKVFLDIESLQKLFKDQEAARKLRELNSAGANKDVKL